MATLQDLQLLALRCKNFTNEPEPSKIGVIQLWGVEG